MSKFAGAGMQSSGGGLGIGRFANFKRKRPSIAQKNLLKDTQDAARRKSHIGMIGLGRRSSVFPGALGAPLHHNSGTGLSNFGMAHKLTGVTGTQDAAHNSKASAFVHGTSGKEDMIEEKSSMDDSDGIIDLDQLEKEL